MNTGAHAICAFLESRFEAERIAVGHDFAVTGLSALDNPLPNTLAFARRPAAEGAAFPAEMLLIVAREHAGGFAVPRIAVDRPRLAFALAARAFAAEAAEAGGIHPSAVVHPSAQVHASAAVGAHSVIGAGSVIGARTRIAHNVVIGPRVRIGADCVVRSGSVIGEDGFGVEEYGDDETVRLPHVGGVVIGDRVEIGSLNSIAAGTIEPTVIESGVQTDNLVHIAHNVHVGAGTLITACAEVSGSVKIGRRVWLGPNCSVINGIEIGDDCLVGIGALVRKSSEPNAVLAGNPARKLGDRR